MKEPDVLDKKTPLKKTTDEKEPEKNKSENPSEKEENRILAVKKEENDFYEKDHRKKKTKDYKYMNICETCTNKNCKEYDTLYGQKYKFGINDKSEDMLEQYDKYCEQKINKLGCVEKNQYIRGKYNKET